VLFAQFFGSSNPFGGGGLGEDIFSSFMGGERRSKRACHVANQGL
jgi:hypothetical protein